MKLKLIEHTQDHRGVELQFPLIGKKFFDKDHCIEVDDEQVDDFMRIDCGFKFVVDEDGNAPEESDSGNVEKHAYREQLAALSIEELNLLFNELPPEKKKNIRKAVDKIKALVTDKYPD